MTGGTEKEFVKQITPRETDFSQWYVDVITKADLVDYAPVRGCMVIKPYGYSIWEYIHRALDRRFKETGHQNAYFPLFIPESYLKKEAEHVEGFAPEVAWVTQGGSEQLAERLAVRPTSETIICAMYSKWIKSWRDLPVLINQWCNVVRWEKTTRPFLRTTEFLWQEGHTAHRSEEEAEEETLRMLEVYRDVVENEMAIPVLAGRKTENEKFAGALRTYTIEALMSDGRALQAGTSHNLGQHFAKVFEVRYLDVDGKLKYVWQTSWGVTTRLIGALVMVHGDDRGLVLPPSISPIQAVVVPITTRSTRAEVFEAASRITDDLAVACRVRLDDREEYTPGWKYNDWEMRGVPLRLEVGPRDVAAGQVIAVRRDTGAKTPLRTGDLRVAVPRLMEEVQANLYAKARSFLDENTRAARTMDELEAVMSTVRGFVVAGWCGDGECELKAKEKTGATIRVIPFEQGELPPACICCGREAAHKVYFARAY